MDWLVPTWPVSGISKTQMIFNRVRFARAPLCPTKGLFSDLGNAKEILGKNLPLTRNALTEFSSDRKGIHAQSRERQGKNCLISYKVNWSIIYWKSEIRFTANSRLLNKQPFHGRNIGLLVENRIAFFIIKADQTVSEGKRAEIFPLNQNSVWQDSGSFSYYHPKGCI